MHKVRVTKLKEARVAAIALLEAHKAAYKNKKIKNNPTKGLFNFSDTRGQRMHQGERYRWVDIMLELQPELSRHVDVLSRLTSSETYALDFVLADRYEKPERICTPNSYA